jgi:hypothetical protein
MTENYEKKCAHVACDCEVEIGKEHFSKSCERAGNTTDCNCGHVDCHAKA